MEFFLKNLYSKLNNLKKCHYKDLLERRSAILDDYIVFLLEHEVDVKLAEDNSINLRQALLSHPNPCLGEMKGARDCTGTLYLLFQALVGPSLITESKYHIQKYKIKLPH